MEISKNNKLTNKQNIKQEKNKLSILTKKCKKTINKPLIYIASDTGEMRHFTPTSQEWYNSVYTYNSNYVKNLPVADKNIVNLLKSFFNSKLKKGFLKTKFKTLIKRFKRLSTKRTFVGKGYLKHTNNNVIITFFLYNTENMFLSSFFKSMVIKLMQPKKRKKNLKYNVIRQGNNNIIKTYNRWFTFNEYLNVPEQIELYYYYTILLVNKFNKKLNNINKYIIDSQYITYNKSLSLNDKLIVMNKYIGEYFSDNRYLNYISFYNFKLKAWKYYMSGYNKYKLLWKLNKVKFNDNFLLKLIYLAKKLYNKRVEFNFVNLKKLHLNSDIFTQALSLKLKNKKNNIYKTLKASLRKVKLPPINKVMEIKPKIDKNKILINKIRNTTISDMSKDVYINKNLNDFLSDLFSYYYPLVDNMKVGIENNKLAIYNKNFSLNNTLGNNFTEKFFSLNSKNSSKGYLTENSSTNHLSINNNSITNYFSVTNNSANENKSIRLSLISYMKRSIKHINLRGIRIEVKGRLTKRATASRSVFKMIWKGGLKNVDSSFKGLSTIMLRGYLKSNIQYSLRNSKNRNGAFGIKTWVSSK